MQVAFGGDQLTSERARSAQIVRVNSENSKSALTGLLPYTSDWHAEVIYLQVYNCVYCVKYVTLWTLNMGSIYYILPRCMHAKCTLGGRRHKSYDDTLMSLSFEKMCANYESK